jgi:hypothetical protein
VVRQPLRPRLTERDIHACDGSTRGHETGGYCRAGRFDNGPAGCGGTRGRRHSRNRYPSPQVPIRSASRFLATSARSRQSAPWFPVRRATAVDPLNALRLQ